MVPLSLEVLLVLLVSGVDPEFPLLRLPEGFRLRMVQMPVVVLLPGLPQFALVAVSVVEMLPLVRVELLLFVLDRGDILGLLVLVVHNHSR